MSNTDTNNGSWSQPKLNWQRIVGFKPIMDRDRANSPSKSHPDQASTSETETETETGFDPNRSISSGDGAVVLSEAVSRRGTIISGWPGSGYNVVVENLVLQDVNYSWAVRHHNNSSNQPSLGAIVVDMGGDFTADLLERLPTAVEEQIVVIDLILDTQAYESNVASLKLLTQLTAIPTSASASTSFLGHETEYKGQLNYLTELLTNGRPDDLSPSVKHVFSQAVRLVLDSQQFTDRVALGVTESVTLDSTHSHPHSPSPTYATLPLLNILSEVLKVLSSEEYRKVLSLLSGASSQSLWALLEEDLATLEKKATIIPTSAGPVQLPLLEALCTRIESLLQNKLLRTLLSIPIPSNYPGALNLRSFVETGGLLVIRFQSYQNFTPDPDPSVRVRVLGEVPILTPSPIVAFTAFLSGLERGQGVEENEVILATVRHILASFLDTRRTQSFQARKLVSLYFLEWAKLFDHSSSQLQIWLEKARRYNIASTLVQCDLATVNPMSAAIKNTIPNRVYVGGGGRGGTEDLAYFARANSWVDPFQEVLIQTYNHWVEPGPGDAPLMLVCILNDRSNISYEGVVRAAPRSSKLANVEPTVLAVANPHSLRGYNLIPYNNKEIAGLIQLSNRPGREGEWEATEQGQALKIWPALPSLCPGLVEELSHYLYEQHELTVQELAEIAALVPTLSLPGDLIDMRQLEDGLTMVVQIEQLEPNVRSKVLSELDEEEWVLYQVARRQRDLALERKIGQQPGLIASNLERILIRSELRYRQPRWEIQAALIRETQSAVVSFQSRRTDQFSDNTGLL